MAAGFAWYEREQPAARVLALVAALAALAVVGRLAFAAIPNVKPTTDIVLFAGYALGAAPGFAVGAITAIVSNVFLSQGPWTVWQMAGWGAVGVGGALLARALRGREPSRFVLAAVCGVRRPRLRRLDGRLPVDARGAPGPRLLPRRRGHLAAVQPRARDRQRRLLPPDRAGLRARARALPAPLRGALAGAGGGDGGAACSWSCWPPCPRHGRGRHRRASVPSATCCAPRTGRRLRRRAAARHRARSTAAGPALGLAAAGHNPRDVAPPGGRSLADYAAQRRGTPARHRRGRAHRPGAALRPASTRATSPAAT